MSPESKKIKLSKKVRLQTNYLDFLYPEKNPKPGSPHIKSFLKTLSHIKTKNRECTDDIQKCLGSIKILGNPVILGAGTFGVLVNVPSNFGSLAVKFIIGTSKKSSSKKFIDTEKELIYSYHMGLLGIGPEILDSFYYNMTWSELEKYPLLDSIMASIIQYYTDKNIESKQFKDLFKAKNTDNVPLEIQCIIMKAYQNDCKKELESKHSIEIKATIIKEMVSLVHMQIGEGIYCYDVKPSNFVVNVVGNYIDVRMIDFGVDYCHETQIYHDYKNTDYVPYSGKKLNMVQMLFISNVLQLYMLQQHSKFIRNPLVLHSYFGHKNKVFKTFFSVDWKSIIKWYISHAIKNESLEKQDPANILVWYSSGNVVSNSKNIYKKQEIESIMKFIIDCLENAIQILARS